MNPYYVTVTNVLGQTEQHAFSTADDAIRYAVEVLDPDNGIAQTEVHSDDRTAP